MNLVMTKESDLVQLLILSSAYIIRTQGKCPINEEEFDALEAIYKTHFPEDSTEQETSEIIRQLTRILIAQKGKDEQVQ